MDIKKIIYFRKYDRLKPYVKVYMTFDEACYIRDYIKSEKSGASGLLKSKLEKILK